MFGGDLHPPDDHKRWYIPPELLLRQPLRQFVRQPADHSSLDEEVLPSIVTTEELGAQSGV